MKKKKILIDLSILKYPNCGLGQIALNYGKYYRDNYKRSDKAEIYLLLPRKYLGAFGSEVSYIKTSWWRKNIVFLFPKFDVWHAIYQLSRFKPPYKSTKYILTIHDFNFFYEKTGKKVQQYMQKIQKKIDRADRIVCISDFAKSETEKFSRLNGKDVFVIKNGVELFDTEKEQKPDFIIEDKPFFFTIGQIKAKKNFHVLLDTMKAFPDKMLYIVGQKGDEYEKFISNRIKSEKLRNIVIPGTVSNAERIWLYHNCEAFLFPSLFEGFGLPVIEAMQFGKPVFSSQNTSLREIGSSYAFFWENFEPEHMIQTIKQQLPYFYKHHEYADNEKLYAQTFSYDKHMNKYLTLYFDLCG